MLWTAIQSSGDNSKDSGRRSGDQEARSGYSPVAKLLFKVSRPSERQLLRLNHCSDPFWVDVVLRNPLNVEVTISGLTVVVQDAKAPEQSTSDFIEVEVLDDLVLGARESRTVSSVSHTATYNRSHSTVQIAVAVKCLRPASLVATHVKFDFLSLLPVTESLAMRGRRLHDTPDQRQNKVYAPDTLLGVEVEDSGFRLHTGFVDDRHLTLYQGERRRVDVRLHNSGRRTISELWLVSYPSSQLWIDVVPAQQPGQCALSQYASR